jgi:hypothetical protein
MWCAIIQEVWCNFKDLKIISLLLLMGKSFVGGVTPMS